MVQIFRKPLLFRRKYCTQTKNSSWQTVIGLEVHAQIKSISKLFSGASTKYASPINTNVSLFDCAIPGTLPVLNKRCVEAGVLTALALNCNVNPISYFDRKHYFYADLPTGYQITQQRAPLASNGYLEFSVLSPAIQKNPYKARVKIKQLQLEQDSGRSLHDVDRSLVDLNRAGVPLMELVFEPDLKDPEEAAALVKELIFILQKIDTCSCRMEEGALRVDANVSINKVGEPLGVRTEIKNIGSVRAVAKAIQYEVKRQINVKNSGGIVINETRAWDASKKVTVAMRDKEVVQDYRYMPEPNLPPLHIAIGPVERGCVSVEEIRKRIPELPEETRERLRNENGLTMIQTVRLVSDLALLKLFEEVVKKRNLDYNALTNLMTIDLIAVLSSKKLDIADIDSFEYYNWHDPAPPVDHHVKRKLLDEREHLQRKYFVKGEDEIYIELNSNHFGDIAELFISGRISRATASYLMKEMVKGNKECPTKIVEEQNLYQISDDEQLTKLCEEAMLEKPKAVKDYKRGKTQALYAFMGAIAKNSNNKADMSKAAKILKELLEK